MSVPLPLSRSPLLLCVEVTPARLWRPERLQPPRWKARQNPGAPPNPPLRPCPVPAFCLASLSAFRPRDRTDGGQWPAIHDSRTLTCTRIWEANHSLYQPQKQNPAKQSQEHPFLLHVPIPHCLSLHCTSPPPAVGWGGGLRAGGERPLHSHVGTAPSLHLLLHGSLTVSVCWLMYYWPRASTVPGPVRNGL